MLFAPPLLAVRAEGRRVGTSWSGILIRSRRCAPGIARLDEGEIVRSLFAFLLAASRWLWAGSTRVYSIRVRRCAPGMGQLDEAWTRGHPVPDMSDYCMPCGVSPAGLGGDPGGWGIVAERKSAFGAVWAFRGNRLSDC
jgi:hypothetical protein